MSVEAVEERPDLAFRAGLEGIKSEVDPRTVEISAANLVTTYPERGQRLRQVSSVLVKRSQPGWISRACSRKRPLDGLTEGLLPGSGY